MAELQRFYYDIAQIAHPVPLIALQRFVPISQILWGTDFPHPNITRWMPNDGDLLDLMPLFVNDAALQKKILVDNPARLYGFDN